MSASGPVFDSYSLVIDYVFDALEGKRTYDFSEFRRIALHFLSEVRRDLGFHRDELRYTGKR